MRPNPEVIKQLDAMQKALQGGADDLTIVNRMRAARGEAPLTKLDFEAFDAFMRDPNAGQLKL